jgi:hypothetical protein
MPVCIVLMETARCGAVLCCAAWLQDEAGALAVQRVLQLLLGLPTSLQRLPAAGLVRDTARSGWGAALYASGAGLAAAVAAVEDAAAEQQRSREAAEAEEGLPEQEDASELLFAVLQQQALLLGAEEVQEAAAALPPPPPAAAAGSPSSSAQAPAAAAAAAAAAAVEAIGSKAAPQRADQQQQQQQEAPAEDQAAAATAAGEAAGNAPLAATGAAAGAGAGAAGAGDPWWEQQRHQPRQHLNPDWWLSLPVLHVPQQLYADGAKGLMAVPVCPPVFVQDGGGSGGERTWPVASTLGGSQLRAAHRCWCCWCCCSLASES